MNFIIYLFLYILSSYFLIFVYFGVLVAHFLQNLWSNSHVNSCLIIVNWGVVGDGPRPTLHFEAMGHATLPPFSCYSCLNMRPPSVRWNASMALARYFCKETTYGAFWFVHIFFFWDMYSFPKKAIVIAPHISQA